MPSSILVFFPHNFFERRHGCHTRYLELVRYFRSRGFGVDVYSLENFETSWEGFDPRREGLVDRVFLYDYRRGLRRQRFTLKAISSFLRRRLLGAVTGAAVVDLFDFAFDSMKEDFARIVGRGKYDYVMIGYAFWAGLLDALPPAGITTVLDMSDFLTLNLFDVFGGRVRLGRLLEDEVARVNRFDIVLNIADEERRFFERLAPRPRFYYVPPSLAAPRLVAPGETRYDILYIASDNAHNKAGSAWFFEHVYPLLEGCRVLVVGDITKHIAPRPGVTLLERAEDLAAVYASVRLSICPMLGGTGIKLKVVESLAHRVPVVCTPQGIAGMPGGAESGCTVAEDPAAFAGAIRRLLSDDDLYHRHAACAGRFFDEHFSEQRVHATLDRIFLGGERPASG